VRRQDFGLYMIITEPFLSYTEIAEIAVRYNIRFLQLREKELSDREILKAADEILAVTDGTNTGFVINDRADLAYICGADCLHLGQGDISLSDARKICRERVSEFGLSTHNPEQVKEAVRQKPDYIGFGPIFPTPTKKKPDPATGTEFIKEAIKLAGNIPVVAIGGINAQNISEVLNAGAKNICMVRYLMETADLEKRVSDTIDMIKQS